MTTRWLGFDVGNSYIKAAWLDESGVETIPAQTSTETIDELVHRALEDRSDVSAAIATVNPNSSGMLVEILKARRVPFRTWGSDGSLFDQGFVGCGVETPTTTGVDRLLACIGAMHRGPGKDIAVVTCGTAITVNLVRQPNLFEGGAIFPGMSLMAKSLEQGTAALPRVECSPTADYANDRAAPNLPGRSTVSAIEAGIYYAASSAIDRIVEEFQASSSDPLVRYITGGDARYLQRGLRLVFEYAPVLVLEGLSIVARKSGAS